MATVKLTASKNFLGEPSEGESGLVKKGATIEVSPGRAAQLHALGWADKAPAKRAAKDAKAPAERKTKEDKAPAKRAAKDA